MLIGIDMLGVQSPQGGDRETGRFGRQLVSALLAQDTANQYLLYTHEGMPTRGVPSSLKAHRVSLAPIPGGSALLRPTIQRVLDQNPDGLDWLILLDPFEVNYGGVPPESPLGGLKVASLILDLAPSLADDRRLAPLRRYDSILAVSETTAAECRRRLGSASWRVSTIGVACDASFAAPDASEPLTKVSGEELGRLGITGPFLFASMVGGTERSNLGGVIDSYHRLPFEQRSRQQLVIAGPVADPWGVVSFLHDRGCAEGLVLAGEVDEETLRTLYGRCSAFVSPSIDEGPGLSLLEAMRCGAPVVAGRAGAQPEILGEAGLLADPSDPSDISRQLTRLLDDVELEMVLRKRALDRSDDFAWEPVVQGILDALEPEFVPSDQARFRIDLAHVTLPRVAIFPARTSAESSLANLGEQIPSEWRDSFNVDLYLEPGDTGVDGLPAWYGAFDARQFERNDGILSYHAVVYRFKDLDAVESKLTRLRARPGLVLLDDQSSLDLLALGASGHDGSDYDRAVARLREVLLTASKVVVHSPWRVDRLQACMTEFADQIVEIPPGNVPQSRKEARDQVRNQLELPPGSLVIGHVGPHSAPRSERLRARTFKAIVRAVPDALHLPMDDLLDGKANSNDSGPIRFDVNPSPSDLISVLDLAIYSVDDAETGAIPLIDLLRAGIPTIAVGSHFPKSVVRNLPGGVGEIELFRAVGELAGDEEARMALGQAAKAFLHGVPDSEKASALMMVEIERCAAEMPRGPGRRQRRPAHRSREMVLTPHSLRPASTTDEAAPRSR